tara:strand:+ start:46 stop:351 length:306 start_codon:yes stop_codon:yes gene_type:complete
MATKLYLAERPAYGIPGGKALLIVDQDGDVVPGQISCDLHQSARELSTVTVTLSVTERSVAIGEPPCMGPVWMRRANAIAAAAIEELAMMAFQYKQSHGLQ